MPRLLGSHRVPDRCRLGRTPAETSAAADLVVTDRRRARVCQAVCLCPLGFVLETEMSHLLVSLAADPVVVPRQIPQAFPRLPLLEIPDRTERLGGCRIVVALAVLVAH